MGRHLCDRSVPRAQAADLAKDPAVKAFITSDTKTITSIQEAVQSAYKARRLAVCRDNGHQPLLEPLNTVSCLRIFRIPPLLTLECFHLAHTGFSESQTNTGGTDSRSLMRADAGCEQLRRWSRTPGPPPRASRPSPPASLAGWPPARPPAASSTIPAHYPASRRRRWWLRRGCSTAGGQGSPPRAPGRGRC